MTCFVVMGLVNGKARWELRAVGPRELLLFLFVSITNEYEEH